MKRNFFQKSLHKLWFSFQIIKTYKTWLYGFIDYLKLLEEKIIIHELRNGNVYAIRTNTSDFGIINEIFIVKEYNRLIKFIKKNSTIIDIGAQIGVFSVFASKIANEGSVFSYEPFIKNFSLFKKNISLNGLNNVRAFRQGVSGKGGERELVISEENTGGHSLYSKGENKIKIETITLKDVFEINKIKTCDFLKIDCEGAEYEILYNTPLKYLKKIKSITLEYHRNSNPFKLKKFLEDAKFKVSLDKIGELLYAWR